MATLKVDSVQLAFDLRKILQDIYLECKQGEIVGLLGRNGCGKSSLLKIIFGTLTPGYKYVSIDGEFISKGYINNKIAYLPQHNYLPRDISIKKLAEVLVSEHYWSEFSNQTIYKNHHHKKSGELSGGELRQLEMLMVLYSRANFILLDEPFTHVTPVQSEYFKTVIKTIGQTKGIIITDHQYQNVWDVSDRVILINEGATKPITHIDELAVYRYISGT